MIELWHPYYIRFPLVQHCVLHTRFPLVQHCLLHTVPSCSCATLRTIHSSLLCSTAYYPFPQEQHAPHTRSLPLAQHGLLYVPSCSALMETEGEGDAGKVRRSPAHPLPDNSEESKLQLQARTAYAKGKSWRVPPWTVQRYYFWCKKRGGGGGTCCDGSSGTVGKKWSKRSRSRFEKEKKHPSIVIIKPVYRIWVNRIRIQPKISIWIGIQKTSNPDLYPSYRYFLTLSGKKFNYFIIIRFSHQKKSMER